MKRIFCAFLGLGLMLSACQMTETVTEGVAEGDAQVTISLYTPDLFATRSLADGANSANGGLSNISLDEYDIRYQLAAYDSDGALAAGPSIVTQSSTGTASFELTLQSNTTYTFVSWADFVTTGTTSDLHYNTEDLTNIYCIDGTDSQLNDESRDAYYANYEAEITGNTSLTLTLTRPFAKLRIVTNDYANEGVTVPDAVSLSYYGCTRFSAINALTGELTGSTLADSGNTEYTGTLATTKEYSAGVDEDDAYRTLLVDYLLAPESEQDVIHLSFTTYSGESEIATTDVSTNVPIQRNYLTTITGQLLTINGNVDVTVDDDTIGENDDDDDSDEFDGYTVDAETNLWKSATVSYSFYYAPGWSTIDNPTYTTDGNCNIYLTFATATYAEWQAQNWIDTDISTDSSNSYDFSCKLTSSTDVSVTVKLYSKSNDGLYYFSYNDSNRISLTAGEEYLLYGSEMTGLDISGDLSLLVDVGGNTENTTLAVEDIVFQLHGADGVYAPEEEEEVDETVYTYDSDTNIWKTVDDTFDDSSSETGDSTYVYYTSDWSTMLDDFTCTHSGSSWSFYLPTATSAQWQAQYHIIPGTSIAVEADTQYDFCCTITSTTSFTGITLKLTEIGNDNNYLMADRITVVADTPYTYTLPATAFSSGAADAVKLVFDFGGNPAETTVDITNIVFQKTTE